MRQRWSRGEQVRVESYLDQHPSLRADDHAVVVLICEEAALRHQHGDQAPLEEYLQRFPQYDAPLCQQLDHQLGGAPVAGGGPSVLATELLLMSPEPPRWPQW
jgi:hypothetical protein